MKDHLQMSSSISDEMKLFLTLSLKGNLYSLRYRINSQDRQVFLCTVQDVTTFTSDLFFPLHPCSL